MSIFAWCSRRAGGLAMLATIALSYWVISNQLENRRYTFMYETIDNLSAPRPRDPKSGGRLLKLFSYYCLLIHFLVFIFPLRSCWAVFTITRNLKKVARARALRDIKFGHRRRGSSTSLSSSETLTSSRDISSTSSSEAGDLELDGLADGDIAPDRVIHAIVIPNYKEENDTLRETLEVLASHPQARSTYDVSRNSPYFCQDYDPAMPAGEYSHSSTPPIVGVATGGAMIFRGGVFSLICGSRNERMWVIKANN